MLAKSWDASGSDSDAAQAQAPALRLVFEARAVALLVASQTLTARESAESKPLVPLASVLTLPLCRTAASWPDLVARLVVLEVSGAWRPKR